VDILISLIVDDGIPNRGHRKNIFSRDFKFTGIGVGRHSKHKHICVIDYAKGYE